ncbi:MAG: hypothetical protein UHK60_03395 [Acutalibacteraceae bacterium]|nr:hypothetical protein [Acutalibacteraceae bacterium]
MQLEDLLENKGHLPAVGIERLYALQEKTGVPIEQWSVKEWEQWLDDENFSTRAIFRTKRSHMRTMLNKLGCVNSVIELEKVNYDNVCVFQEEASNDMNYVRDINELMSIFERTNIDFYVSKFSFIWSAYILFWYGFTLDDVRIVKKSDLLTLEIKRQVDGKIIKLAPKPYEVLRKFEQQRETLTYEEKGSSREYAISEFLFRKGNNPRPRIPHYRTGSEFRKVLQEYVWKMDVLKTLNYKNIYDSGYFYRVNDEICKIKESTNNKYITQLPEFRELFDDHREIRGKEVKSTNVYREIYRRFVAWHNLYYDNKITD